MANIDADQIDDLKSRVRITELLQRFGVKVRAGMCLCPFHNENTPSCKVYERENRIFCHGCHKGADAFDVLKHLGGMSFPRAIEYLGGSRTIDFEERRKIREAREQADKAEKDVSRKAHAGALALIERGDEIKGTAAQRYLVKRGLTVSKRMSFDLRFVDKLTYRGFPDPRANETVDLGEYPALLAIVRVPATKQIIGCHRTYIDPKTYEKLTPPGDLKRNKSKKILGEFVGGMIHLSEDAESLIIGEGTETSLSGYDLGLCDPSYAVGAAVNLWNLCGSSTATFQNPRFPNDPARRVSNGICDPEKPGLIFPPHVRSLLLLGDGDSEPAWTQGMMATAAHKAMSAGIDVSIAFAPAQMDFNDALREERGGD